MAQLCRDYGRSDASFYRWRAKCSGADASMVSRLEAIEDENRRLKRR
ncbi:MAG: transposase [Natronohydrobacter sp.]|nr:transposase [Natronohydrobacter sp.]